MDINAKEAIKILGKCKNILKAADSQEINKETIILEQISELIKSNQTGNTIARKSEQEKLNNLEKLLTCGEFKKIKEQYKIQLSQELLTNKDNLIEYWLSLNDDKKVVFSITELRIIYYVITKSFDSRKSIKKDKLIARIDELIYIKRRGEELSKNYK